MFYNERTEQLEYLTNCDGDECGVPVSRLGAGSNAEAASLFADKLATLANGTGTGDDFADAFSLATALLYATGDDSLLNQLENNQATAAAFGEGTYFNLLATAARGLVAEGGAGNVTSDDGEQLAEQVLPQWEVSSTFDGYSVPLNWAPMDEVGSRIVLVQSKQGGGAVVPNAGIPSHPSTPLQKLNASVVPGRVQSRVNLRNGDKDEGIIHIRINDINNTNTQSKFSIS